MPQKTVRRFSLLSAGLAIGAVSSLTLGSPVAHADTPKEVDVKSSKVFVVGDSLTVGAAPYLRRSLAPKVRSLTVDAQVGRFTGPGISKLQTRQAKRAQIWVVALGTNDGPSSRQTRTNVKKVMRLAGNRTVIWVNVVRPGGYGSVNRVLRSADNARGNLTVLDWAAVIRSKSSLLTGDRVHLTSYGYKIRAKLTKRAVLALDTTS
jgi:lysophospholipase L1-like esterase